MRGVVDADGHVVEQIEELTKFGWDGRPTGNATLDMMLERPEQLRRVGLCAAATPWDPDARLPRHGPRRHRSLGELPDRALCS